MNIIWLTCWVIFPILANKNYVYFVGYGHNWSKKREEEKNKLGYLLRQAYLPSDRTLPYECPLYRGQIHPVLKQ